MLRGPPQGGNYEIGDERQIYTEFTGAGIITRLFRPEANPDHARVRLPLKTLL